MKDKIEKICKALERGLALKAEYYPEHETIRITPESPIYGELSYELQLSSYGIAVWEFDGKWYLLCEVRYTDVDKIIERISREHGGLKR